LQVQHLQQPLPLLLELCAQPHLLLLLLLLLVCDRPQQQLQTCRLRVLLQQLHKPLLEERCVAPHAAHHPGC
jgi:hypothetical protein